MNKWYREMSKGQKVFVYLVALALTPVFIGFVLLVILIYLELAK